GPGTSGGNPRALRTANSSWREINQGRFAPPNNEGQTDHYNPSSKVARMILQMRPTPAGAVMAPNPIRHQQELSGTFLACHTFPGRHRSNTPTMGAELAITVLRVKAKSK